MAPPLNAEEHKQLVKDALKEWLDAKLLEFSYWSIKGVLALALAGAAYLILWSQGWHRS